MMRRYKKSQLMWSFTLLLILIPNSIITANVDESLEDFSIEVDSSSKTINEGEEAIFHWNVTNDSPIYTYEFSVFGDQSEFSSDKFVLYRGERIEITQHIDPSTNPTNGSTYIVNWHVIEKFERFIETNSFMVISVLEVIIVNNNADNISNLNSENDTERSNNNLNYYFIAISLIVIVIFFIVIIKMLKKK